MKESASVDFLIIGQGLAGSLLAWLLLRRGQRVMVVDNGSPSSASRVAAGLVNPVTGRRLVKTPQVDKFLPVACRAYQTLEKSFKMRFFFAKDMLRLFRSEEEWFIWQKRKADPEYRPYLAERFKSGATGYPLSDAFGSFRQLKTAYLTMEPLLDRLKAFFQEKKAYIEAPFCHEDIQFKSTALRWKKIKAKRIVFCEGYRMLHNPWFSWLPLQPAQGEILTLQAGQKWPDAIINREKWLLPLPKGQFKLGATYRWRKLDERPSETGRRELLEALEGLFNLPFSAQLRAHRAGIRPHTRDKAPFIGAHPKDGRFALFNGFGSKGVLLIPYYGMRLVDHFLYGKPLPAEADIGRYDAASFTG